MGTRLSCGQKRPWGINDPARHGKSCPQEKDYVVLLDHCKPFVVGKRCKPKTVWALQEGIDCPVSHEKDVVLPNPETHGLQEDILQG